MTTTREAGHATDAPAPTCAGDATRAVARPADPYAALELAHRDAIVGGLRDRGQSYRQIAATLGINTRKVEAILGEAARLRENGYSTREIAERIGAPRTTVQRLLRPQKSALSLSTARKSLALAGLSEMYGMQLDVLGWFLGMSEPHTYVLVRQLREQRLLLPLMEVQPGIKWVVPTRDAAASVLGWVPRSTWRPPLKDAAHYRAVAQARIMLVGAEPGVWISERQLRHDAEHAARQESSRGRRAVGHIHDGRFLGVVDGTYGWWALEVELTAKSTANMDTALRGAIRTARDAAPDPMIGVLYLVRGRDVNRVVLAAAERLPAEFATLDMHLVVRDFATDWARFLDHRTALAQARRAARPATPRTGTANGGVA
ncbi:helix-turn-helix domain-containing protein [Nocardia puris]|uniref:helix-turn-helix domain-containing protein n=1 Tax=Nocardia puris TaxID=208602 RepID=UPI00189400E9|nr:helix-turn-helix domain-containing protein [Nocardia puris]MBF6463067.1 helix-turn-helix domain-containing protein [Nocardia puris]